jgi:hypothetical protein
MKSTLFLFLFLLLSTCENKPKYEATFLECGTEQDKVYDLTQEYFSKDDTIHLNTRVVLAGVDLSVKSINQRVELLNNFFSRTKIRLVVNKIDTLPVKPTDNPKSLEAITLIESYLRRPQPSLRESYHIKDFRDWAQVHKDANYINIFIFKDDKGYPPGLAEAIPSNTIAIQSSFFLNPFYYTLEHEIAHAVGGLYHTHEDDHTDGLNNVYGDKVRDTYKSIPDLYNYVDSGCNFKEVKGVPLTHTYTLVSNVMSYTLYECRDGFTPVQVMRMLNTLEISAELRKTIITKKIKKVETWDILKEHYQ